MRCHLIMPMTGYVVSPTAVCIAWAAIRPGTTKSKYDVAPSSTSGSPSMKPPSSTPIAST